MALRLLTRGGRLSWRGAGGAGVAEGCQRDPWAERPPQRAPRPCTCRSLAPAFVSLRASCTKKFGVCLFYANMETRLTALLAFANKLNSKGSHIYVKDKERLGNLIKHEC